MDEKSDKKIFIALIVVFGLLLFYNSSLNNTSVEASNLKELFGIGQSIHEKDRKNNHEGTSVEIIEDGKLTKNTQYNILYNHINDTYLVYTESARISEHPSEKIVNVMPNRTKKYKKDEYKYAKNKSFKFVEEGKTYDSFNNKVGYFIFEDKDNGQLWLLIESLDSDRQITFQPIEGSGIKDFR